MKVVNKSKEIIKKYKTNSLFLIIILTAVVLLFPNLVYADWVTKKLLFGLTWVVFYMVNFVGQITIFILHMVAHVAGYNDFVNAATVIKGWVIVRDLCNMFFILILLIIAFATILRQENYSAKVLLPKLLIMAVLINFSKTICGLIIDFSQVIMLTFVNGFAGGGINNLAILLGMDNLVAMAEKADKTNEGATFVQFTGVLGALAAGLIAFVVIAVMLCVFIMRIIMLWVYVILSPLAYLLAAFPAGKEYSTKWWTKFSENVIVGPVLAFFVWLALSTAGESSSAITKSGFQSELGSNFFTDSVFQTYAITIALLVGGLMVTQQIGGIAGSIAGKGMGAIQKGMGAIQKGGSMLKNFGVNRAKDAAKFAARNTLRAAGGAIGFVGSNKYLDNKDAKGEKIPGTTSKIGAFVGQWGKDMQTTRAKEKAKKRQKRLEQFGMRTDIGGSQEKLDTVMKDKRIKGATNFVKGVGVLGLGVATGGMAGVAMGAYGVAKGAHGIKHPDEKGPIAHAMKYFGKGKKVRETEKEVKDREEAKEKEMQPLTAARVANLKSAEITRGTAIEGLGSRPEVDEDQKKDYDDKLNKINKDHDEQKEKSKYIEVNRLRDIANVGRFKKIYTESEYKKEVGRIDTKYNNEQKTNDKNIENSRNTEIGNLNTNPKYSSVISSVIEERKYEDEEKKINKTYKDEEKKINKTFKTGTETVNKKHDLDITTARNEAATATKNQNKFGKWAEERSKEMKGPNHWTIEGIKEGTKENNAVHNIVRDLGVEDIGAFSKGSFHSPGGPNSKNQKTFDLLNASTQEAAKRITFMANSIKNMPKILQPNQKNMVLEFKRMLAAQSAGGKSLNNFSDLITELEKRDDIGDKKGNYTIAALAKTFSAGEE
ncbi:hypothetical protein KKH16_01300 [Patescibacteria group bacterium]|nr:hypothetical protein [Patescibacteria group bacterium]